MMDYLLTNIIISVAALLMVKGLKNAPARARFYVLMFALAAWFVPWHLFPEVKVSEQPLSSTFTFEQVRLNDPIVTINSDAVIANNHSKDTAWYQLLTWWHLVLSAMVIGVTLFITKVISYLQLIKRLENEAVPCDSLSTQYSVKVVDLATPGITTGIITPVIWLDHKVLAREELDSVLLHEMTHIKQHDVYWIWFICFTENLFWWNPICMLLGAQARQKLELSCDERCFSQRQQQYQFDLASLTLEAFATTAKRTQFCSPVLNIAHTKRFNVQRVKMLNKEKVMKKRHIAMMAAAISFTTIAAAQITPKQTKAEQTAKATQSKAYDEQMNDLLIAAKEAKSDDPKVLADVAQNIIQWQINRPALPGYEESDIKLSSYTLINHVLHKMGDYQQAINVYELWYKDDNQVPFFTRNTKANTLLQLGQPELAVKELILLKEQIGPRIKDGSLMLLAHAYIDLHDYDNALATLSHENIDQDDVITNVYKRFIYTKQNDIANANKAKAKLPPHFANAEAALLGYGLPQSPLLAQL